MIRLSMKIRGRDFVVYDRWRWPRSETALMTFSNGPNKGRTFTASFWCAGPIGIMGKSRWP